MVYINNQRGDSTLLSIVFILICACLAIGFLSFRIQHLKHQQAKQELILCNTVYKGETKRIIKRVETINLAIVVLTTGKAAGTVATLMVPGIGLVARRSFGIALKGAKAAQQGLYLSYRAKIFKLSKKCTLNPRIFLGPYKTKNNYSKEI